MDASESIMTIVLGGPACVGTAPAADRPRLAGSTRPEMAGAR